MAEKETTLAAPQKETDKQLVLLFKNVVVTSYGPIDTLNRTAPIYDPFILGLDKILQTIVEGHKVCEVRQDGSRVPLTRDNYNKGEMIATPIDKENGGCCGLPGNEGGGSSAGLPDMSGKTGRFLKVFLNAEKEPNAGWYSIKWEDIIDAPEIVDAETLKEYATLNHGHELVTDKKSGFMSPEDKTKLDKSHETMLATIKEAIPSVVKEINQSDENVNEFSAKKVRYDTHQTVDYVLTKLIEDNEKNKLRTFVFVFPTGLMSGPLPVKHMVPWGCTLQNVSAVCEHDGNKDVIISMERITEKDYEAGKDNAWYDITSDRIVLKPNNKVIPDTRLTVEDLHENEIIRLNVLQYTGGVSSLTVNLTVKMK